jgi:hypothetical protein
MKFEEVLPHLRNGGKVICEGYKWGTFEDICKYGLGSRALQSNDWEIIDTPYKKEHIISFVYRHDYAIDGDQHITLGELFPNVKNKKYKVTIEEIEE